MTDLTYGQKTVNTQFNPSESTAVAECKNEIAKIIDQMNNLRATSKSEEQKSRCSISIMNLETALMWAVKALTWSDSN